MADGKIRRCGVLGAIIVILLFITFPIKAEGADNKIRVGYFRISGYQDISEDGSRWGLSYDYLQEIAKHTGWEYEFVDATWSECLEMLEAGEIDIVTCARSSDERREKYEYSEHRMGLSCSVLTVRKDDERYYYNDFQSFDNMKVGLLKGNHTNKQLKEILDKYHISMEEQTFNTEPELRAALADGDIDAIAASSQRVIENEKVIAKFGLGSSFIIAQKGDRKIMDQLDNAMKNILLAEPYYEAELHNKYIGSHIGYKVALTKEEKAYTEQHNTVRMAFSADAEPMFQKEGNQYSGIVADSIKAMAEEVGMSVEFIETASYKESLELMKEGKINLIGDFYLDYSWGDRNGIILTNPYLSAQYVEIVPKGVVINPDEVRVATCEQDYFNTGYIWKHYPKEKAVYYETDRACIEAVRKGQADATFVNQYTAAALLKEDKNLKLIGKTLYESGYQLAVAVPEEDKTLCHIFNKAINNLESSKIEQIVEQYTTGEKEKVSLISYIYYNPLGFLCIVTAFFGIVVLVLLYIIFVKRKYNSHIIELAYRDQLTGLENIHGFEEKVEKRWLEYRGKDVFVLSIDISRFTTINENFGRGVGDLVICYVGRKLEELCGPRVTVARSKVDNFLVFGIYIKEEEIQNLVDLITEKMGVFKYEDNNIYLTYNCGIVKERATPNTSVKKLIDRAEMARKAAKKDQTHMRYYNKAMEKKLLREKAIEDSMGKALNTGEFLVYYQPKYCMADNTIIGAEALVRWKSVDFGFMSPAEFIPILESNGFIVELDFFVMEQVYKMLRERLDQGKKVVRVSINQSRMHFTQKNYLDRLNALREKYSIPNELIELELTESIFANIEDIGGMVDSLKENGYYLSVDDFGSGYSSLNMLKEVPIDTLKIDKGFLDHTDGNGRYQKVICKVVELAEDLNMHLICEGVETKEQAEFLQSIGCHYAQGYLYSKPVPEEIFMDMLE